MDADNFEENLESYRAQLKQVEAALLIDESDEDLQKLKKDLEEVIALTEDLMKNEEEMSDVKREWKVGDDVKILKKSDRQYHDGVIDMIADDKVSCTVKFDNSGSVAVIKVSDLLPMGPEGKRKIVPQHKAKNNKLTRQEIDKRREAKKVKLTKKKQRMKDFEEAREAGKQRWQTFFKKGDLKGKHKVKGLNKKSIFASATDGKGKIGIGTCGTSGKGMTSYTSATQYMYKK